MMVKHAKPKAATKGCAALAKSSDNRESPEAIAERVKWLRKHVGLNQTAFGKRVGAGQQAVSGWETGDPKYSIGVGYAMELCRVFDVSLDWIYRGRTSGLTVAMEQAYTADH